MTRQGHGWGFFSPLQTSEHNCQFAYHMPKRLQTPGLSQMRMALNRKHVHFLRSSNAIFWSRIGNEMTKADRERQQGSSFRDGFQFSPEACKMVHEEAELSVI